jgi:hypothetical protein
MGRVGSIGRHEQGEHNLGDIKLLQDDAMRTYVASVDALIKQHGLAADATQTKPASDAKSPSKKAETPSDSWVLRKINGKIFNIQLNRPDKKNALTPAVNFFDKL